MIRIDAIRGDIYGFIMQNDPYIVLHDEEVDRFNKMVMKPVDIHRYVGELDLISQYIIIKAAYRPIVLYLSFSGQNGELDADIDLLCDLLVKHSDGKETGSSGMLTLFVENDDNYAYIFDRLKKNLPDIHVNI